MTNTTAKNGFSLHKEARCMYLGKKKMHHIPQSLDQNIVIFVSVEIEQY